MSAATNDQDFHQPQQQDKTYAHQLADKLTELGVDVWIDWPIDSGDEWESAIFEGLNGVTRSS